MPRMMRVEYPGAIYPVIDPGDRRENIFVTELSKRPKNDERLQQIQNLNPSGQNLSSFGYAYDANGTITNWTEQTDANVPTVQVLQYDPVNQLLGSTVFSNTVAGTILKQFIYTYDHAGNRTGEQVQTGTNNPPSINSASYNDLNQLTSSTGANAPVRFSGYLNQVGTVTIAGSPARISAQTNFTGFAHVSPGTNTVQVIASNSSGYARTNNYQIVVTNLGAPGMITYDLNGNETSVVTATSTNTFQWDAANRLVSITGPTNQSIFSYDGMGRRNQIIELQNGMAVSTNLYLWCGMELCEERDNTGGTVVKRFFDEGEQMSGTNYFFSRDHLGSIREMTDSSGTIQARYEYDPYGKTTKISGALNADFTYAGYYCHAASGLLLTFLRAYNSQTGRWINRDLIGESGGLNLYAYVLNNPANWLDPFGACGGDGGGGGEMGGKQVSRSSSSRAKQFGEGALSVLLGSVAVAVSEGPWAPFTAVSGAIGISTGTGNMVAAFAPNDPQHNALAKQMEEFPSSLGQAAGRSIGGRWGQAMGGAMETVAGLPAAINYGKLLEASLSAQDFLHQNMETADDSFNDNENHQPSGCE